MKLALQIPAQHPVYAGHFPGAPIVPGALLITWIVDALARHGIQIGPIRACKFLAPVQPGCSGTVHAEGGSTEWSIRFEVDGRTCLRLTGLTLDDADQLAQ